MAFQWFLALTGLVAVAVALNPAQLFPGPGGLGALMGGVSGRPGDAMSLLAPHLAGPGGKGVNIWPGVEPGITYPNYTEAPETAFTCQGLSDGYYPDVDTRCQAARLCEGGSIFNTTLCPVGSMYHTAHGLRGICDWWYNVPCGAKPAPGPFFLSQLPARPMMIKREHKPAATGVAQVAANKPASVAADVAATEE